MTLVTTRQAEVREGVPIRGSAAPARSHAVNRRAFSCLPSRVVAACTSRTMNALERGNAAG